MSVIPPSTIAQLQATQVLDTYFSAFIVNLINLNCWLSTHMASVCYVLPLTSKDAFPSSCCRITSHLGYLVNIGWRSKLFTSFPRKGSTWRHDRSGTYGRLAGRPESFSFFLWVRWGYTPKFQQVTTTIQNRYCPPILFVFDLCCTYFVGTNNEFANNQLITLQSNLHQI